LSLVRARTRRGIGGLGSTVSSSGVLYNDTGEGMTPESFQSSCCLGIAGEYGSSAGSTLNSVLNPFSGGPSAGSVCDDFLNGNMSLFGGADPCSSAGGANLLTPAPVLSVAPIIPPASAYTPSQTQYVPVLTCPASVSPCPCNGQAVVDAASAAALITCQALAQSVTQNVAVIAQMTANASAQCVTQKVTCAQNIFETVPSADCSTCVLDITNWKVWAVGIGLVVGGLVLVKSLAP